MVLLDKAEQQLEYKVPMLDDDDIHTRKSEVIDRAHGFLCILILPGKRMGFRSNQMVHFTIGIW
jgi:hypothetical protein